MLLSPLITLAHICEIILNIELDGYIKCERLIKQ